MDTQTRCPVNFKEGGWQGIYSWTNTLKDWVISTSPHGDGAISFFKKYFYDLDPKHPRDYLSISLAHKVSATAFAHPKFWPLFNVRKGQKVLGGEELDKVSLFITSETPLTKNDNFEEQRVLKHLCMRNLFSRKMIERQFPDIYEAISNSIERFIDEKGLFDASEAIIQGVSRANSMALFAPHGSNAQTVIRALLHNPKWDEVPRSVEIIGEFLNQAVLFSPQYFATRGKEELVRLIKKIGVDLDERLTEVNYQTHFNVLKEATTWIREASLRALETPTDEAASMQGMIELMYESVTDCKDPVVLKVLQKLLEEETRIHPDVLVRTFLLSENWKRKFMRAKEEDRVGVAKAFIDELEKGLPTDLKQPDESLRPMLTFEGINLTSVRFKTYTDEQIEGMIRLILVVGQRTTTFTLEAALRLLILYPEWQEKIYEEIQEKCPDGNITSERVKSLRTLQLFLLEVYRLNPAVLIQTRETIEDMQIELTYKNGKLASVKKLKCASSDRHLLQRLGGVLSSVAQTIYRLALKLLSLLFLDPESAYKKDLLCPNRCTILSLPKGTTTAYIHLFAQRHPDVFKDYDPGTFYPERFLMEENGKLEINREKKSVVKNFSGSPSNCCGEWLAKEGTIPAFLVHAIKNYVLSAENIEEIEESMTPVGGAMAVHKIKLNRMTMAPRLKDD